MVEKIILLTFYTYFFNPNTRRCLAARRYGRGVLAISRRWWWLCFLSQASQVLSQRPQIGARFRRYLSPTLVRPLEGAPHALANAAALLMVAGILFQIVSKSMWDDDLESWRLIEASALRDLNRIVRHPIYMGYLLTHIGFLCLVPLGGIGHVLHADLLADDPRIFAEETTAASRSRVR